MADYIIADYVDFEVHVRPITSASRVLINGVQQIEQKYARKERMAEQGLVSEEAAQSFVEEKRMELAKLYCKHVIVGWKGSFKNKPLPEFSEKAAVELFGSKEADLLFADVVETSMRTKEAEAEQDEVEIKNSKAS